MSSDSILNLGSLKAHSKVALGRPFGLGPPQIFKYKFSQIKNSRIQRGALCKVLYHYIEQDNHDGSLQHDSQIEPFAPEIGLYKKH